MAHSNIAVFAKASFSFMLPLLWRHFWQPIKLDNIPAIREDDSAATSLGAFRADQAYWDKKYAEQHDGQLRRRNLGINLIRFFLPEIVKQCVSALQGPGPRVDLSAFAGIS